MRTSAVVLSLLLLLAPLGLAQDGSTSGSPTPSPDEDPCHDAPDEDACQEDLERRCRGPDNRTDPRCRDDGDEDDDGNETEDGDDRPDSRPARCDDANRTADDQDRCRQALDAMRGERRRTWVSFDLEDGNATLANYTIDGLRALDAVAIDLDNLSIERRGSTLRVLGDGAELRLHDEPNGLIRFKGDAGNVTLDLPAGVAVERGEHGARLLYPDGREGHLVAENATWVGNESVVLVSFFSFHVPPAREHAAADGDGDDAEERAEVVQERTQQAIERRAVGAEVKIKAREEQRTLAPDDQSIEILAYDDVEVEVHVPAEVARVDAPLRVVVSSELAEGRTIVIDVDESVLASTDAGDLRLAYFDLHPQADGTTWETEVVFKAAASLQDVLDPADDAGQPEFWLVEDANGVQVLVSVPHWSAHAITVASIATALSAPSVAVGIVAGVAASALAGTLLLWPRRRDDDEL